MSTVGLVVRSYKRLTAQHEEEMRRGAVERSTIFQEWAVNKVFLDADATKRASEHMSHFSRDGALLRNIIESFLETGEKRLIPAQSHDKDGRDVFVLILRP